MISPQPLGRVTLSPLFLALGGRFQRTVALAAPREAAYVSGRRAPTRRRDLTVLRHKARTSPRCPPPASGGLVGDMVTHDGRNKYSQNRNVPEVHCGSMTAATAGAPEGEVGGRFPPRRKARLFPYSWSGDAAAELRAPASRWDKTDGCKHHSRKTNIPGTSHLRFLSKLVFQQEVSADRQREREKDLKKKKGTRHAKNLPHLKLNA